jgi:hypothetical protein
MKSRQSNALQEAYGRQPHDADDMIDACEEPAFRSPFVFRQLSRRRGGRELLETGAWAHHLRADAQPG